MRDFSVALTSTLHADLARHLVREDGAEDLTFLVWRPSAGATRDSVIMVEAVMPNDGERHVHGNVSFESSYFLRACNRAADLGGGVALIHSHPGARRWPGLSRDDYVAESGHAAQALQLTGRPLVGLTLAGATKHYSARRWDRTAPREWIPRWADRVRVVGDQMLVSLPEGPAQHTARYQRRTIDTWGADIQQILGSLNIGVVGAGSVGSQIIEALVRTGIGSLLIMDYDTVEDHNLDRIINATVDAARRALSKAEVAAAAARAHATHPGIQVIVSESSAVEAGGLDLLKDCDLIFSCVDRPAGRATLNALAYAHLIPVIDGGVLVTPGRRVMRGAEWRAHVASPGRRCLECIGQYDPGLVQADRDGLLADPSYLAQLPDDSPLKRNENVFAFSAAAAAAQVLAALRMIVAPAGIADVGAQTFHFATGTTDLDERGCDPGCLYSDLEASGDSSGRPVAHRHVAAEAARASRAAAQDRVRELTTQSVNVADHLRRLGALLRRIAMNGRPGR